MEGPGVERPLQLTYDDLSSIQQVSIVQALECAGNGRAFFEELQVRRAEGTPWGLGAVGVAEWTPARLQEGRHVLSGRSWSGYGAIFRVEYSVGGGPWREARLFG